ncbi:hypothetical protein ACFWJ4_13740 [Kitasatospora sp. NPDC127067]|uniref:hypothetical protein n=1 Tax=Kitasatospora sp. NPDC127067 TaxID=3347126 RepID=UPI003668FBBF
MIEWGRRLGRRGCWFSWRNLEEIIQVLEEEVPHGQLEIRHSATNESTQGGVSTRTQQTRRWATLADFKTDVSGAATLRDLVIERGPAPDGRHICIEIGETAKSWRPGGMHARTYANVNGGTDAWQLGVARRLGDVLREAWFLGPRLDKWVGHVQSALLFTAVIGIVFYFHSTGSWVGLGAAIMALAIYKIEKYLARAMLINDPKGLLKFVAHRRANHRPAGSPWFGGAALIWTVLGGVAGVIGTVLAIFQAVFQHG